LLDLLRLLPLRGCCARSSLGLRAHRQPEKPTLRLGTLSCLQHFFFVRLDQRFAIRPLLALLLCLAVKEVTSLEPRTPHQPDKLKKLSKNDLVVLLLNFQSIENTRLQLSDFSIECSASTSRWQDLVQPRIKILRNAASGAGLRDLDRCWVLSDPVLLLCENRALTLSDRPFEKASTRGVQVQTAKSGSPRHV